jgi:hypothetical protein
MVIVMPGCRCRQRAGDSGPSPVATLVRTPPRGVPQADQGRPQPYAGRGPTAVGGCPCLGSGFAGHLRCATGIATRLGRSRGCSPTGPSGTMRLNRRAPSVRRCRSAGPTMRSSVANPCGGPQGGRARSPTRRGPRATRSTLLVGMSPGETRRVGVPAGPGSNCRYGSTVMSGRANYPLVSSI